MKLLSTTFFAASIGLAAAHGDHEGQHIPKLVGGRKLLADLNMRRGLLGHDSVVSRDGVSPTKQQESLRRRQDDDDPQCGPGIGSCDAGYCCSAEGWCGKTKVYCAAPDCQINYSSGCDGNKKPSGVDTASVARPKLSSVLYGGAGIYDCVNNGEIALTFDDGPYIYTNDLLDKLKAYGAKATFFITGNNLGKGQINDPASIYPAILRRMHAEGHQIASHTWSHQNASQLTNTQFTNQMVWNEIAINSVMGFFPTYMRPPYSICEKNCQNILSTLGYHAIYFDLDTAGYLNDDAKKIQTSKNIWDQAMRTSNPNSDSFLQIEHDIHQQVVYNLTDYILTSLISHGYQSVTVGQCLGDPASNWYRAGPAGSVTNPVSSAVTSKPTTPTTASTRNTRSTVGPVPTGTTTVTKDGTCGNGVTCAGSRYGSCCSTHNFCGVGDDYCKVANGCQAAFGTCDDAPVSTRITRSSISSKNFYDDYQRILALLSPVRRRPQTNP
ncbi:glycoside hydrolase/deacetylase [Apodospora peruviana]|uniref:Glycoside hydrolase/deacetylase n=1 Tax=Apodospora peruviana TaxID=516989 RepID=A0AAE0IC44_9PEZI|nr:glycoside hydrolase/deacetylase [Apodospora peruviana]